MNVLLLMCKGVCGRGQGGEWKGGGDRTGGRREIFLFHWLGNIGLMIYSIT